MHHVSGDSVYAGLQSVIRVARRFGDSSGGVLFCDCFNCCISLDVYVHVSNDDGDLVSRGRGVGIIDLKGAKVFQIQVPSGIRAFQGKI